MRRNSGHPMRVRNLALVIAAAGALAAAGCGDGSTAPKTGSLTVTITSPGGVTPHVTVSGPGGYSKAVTATTTLTGLAVGSYTVAAAPVTTSGAIVGTVNAATVTGSPASVTANTTATATATYAQQPGTGGLWVANFKNPAVPMAEFSAAQLASSTSAPAAIAIATGAAENFGVVFDASGNLWVSLFGANNIVEYTVSQLATSGTPTPAVVLIAATGSLSVPSGMAFDASGNLWVANVGNNTLVEFTPSQLASSGSPTPAVTISANTESLTGPTGLAFDANGNLWVANNGTTTVVEFTPTQLATTGSPAPTVTLTGTAGSIDDPVAIAFDPSGDMWVTNMANSTVVEFAPSQLVASGSPTPAVTLSSAGGSLVAPTGAALDASGNLWIANFNFSSPTVVEFAASQLVSSGSPTPNVTNSSSTLGLPVMIAFNPHAAGLPIKP